MASLYLSILLPILLNLVSWYTILGVATFPIAVLATRYALTHYDHPLPLTPAYAGTVANHLFTGLFLAWSYIMVGLEREPVCVLIWGIIFIIIASAFYVFTERKAKAAATLI
jgi:hypothetical protein